MLGSIVTIENEKISANGPDAQEEKEIANPAFNPEEDVMWVGGLRGRVMF